MNIDQYRLPAPPRGRPRKTKEQRMQAATAYRLKIMKPEDRAAIEVAVWARHYREVEKMKREALDETTR